ncbi:MAG TPA: fused MFS/spermidine synthase [Verrucomicrobiae bacterium]|nr:fused MFS/spermidine synthase [Verrucomicrobiae bacterium]
MRIITPKTPLLMLLIVFASNLAFAPVIYETTSPYHHIRVVDQGGMRSLLFDNATQSQISLQSPLKGHFEYTEYFHMAWLWNARLTNVLMIGLGGGTAQQAFVHHYPGVIVRTVEIDPVVVQVASNFFSFRQSARQKVSVEDGRTFLRRSPERYDLIILDAYVHSRYGSAIPQHLVTKEFFELTRDHLTTNGVVAYNVIGTLNAWNADVVGAIYRTLNSVFPQVYIFKTTSTRNLVLVAIKSPTRLDLNNLRARANFLVQNGMVKLPTFRSRVEQLHAQAPPNAARSPILTDDYAPVEGLAASQDRAR